ncbi:MAG: ribosome maturation factor RimM [Bacteroidota bacterium]
MERKDCVELGYIAKARGLKGEVKAVFDVHNLREYKREEGFYLAKKGAPLKFYSLQSLRIQNQGNAVLHFEGINDRDTAESLKSHTIFFPKEELPELPKGHFYFFQVIGYEIEDKKHGSLGKVSGFWDGPAQDVLVIDYQGAELLVPVMDEFVLQADHEQQILYTAVPNGLIEAYTNAEEEDADTDA